MKKMTCPLCLREFTQVQRNQKYCSEACRTTAYKKQLAEYKQRADAARHRQKNDDALGELSKAANEHGMTYGKYVAMLRQEAAGK